MTEPGTPTIVTLEPRQVVVVRGTDVPADDIRDFFDSSFQTLATTLAEQGIEASGPAFARYLPTPTETMDIEVGYPLHGSVDATDQVQLSELPAGRAAQVVHIGGYDELSGSWERLTSWVQEQGARPAEGFFEEYLTEPTPDADPSDMRTRLNLPLRDEPQP